MAAVENARDLGALPFRIGDAVEVRGVFEYLSDVRIGEATDHVLAGKQGAEDLNLVAGDVLNALAVRLGAICLRVVMRSKVRMASVGSSTWAKALR